MNKRKRGTGNGMLVTCLYTRAVFADVAHDCSTYGFLTVFRRYIPTTALNLWVPPKNLNTS